MKPTLLILAAGMGSRFGGLKQLEPVGPAGETVLDYSVFDALRAGFGRVVFLIRKDFEEAFRERVGKKWEARAEVVYAHQALDSLPAGFAPPPGREKPWGTAHAVWCARKAIDTSFAVVNADDFYGADAYAKLAAFLRERLPPPPRFCMIGYPLGQTLSDYGTVSRGVCRLDGDGFLDGIEEVAGLERDGDGARAKRMDGTVRAFPGSKTVSMNCWGFRKMIFAELERGLAAFLKEHGKSPTAEFYLPTAVATLVSKGAVRVHVLPTTGRWFGVTYREDTSRVIHAVAGLTTSGEYSNPLLGA